MTFPLPILIPLLNRLNDDNSDHEPRFDFDDEENLTTKQKVIVASAVIGIYLGVCLLSMVSINARGEGNTDGVVTSVRLIDRRNSADDRITRNNVSKMFSIDTNGDGIADRTVRVSGRRVNKDIRPGDNVRVTTPFLAGPNRFIYPRVQRIR